MLRLVVLGSTRGTSLQPIIDAIAHGTLQATIVLVVSNKPDALILERARTHGIPAVYLDMKKNHGSEDERQKTREEYDRDIMTLLDQHHIDLILLIGYMRLLSSAFVQKWHKKIMNVHPSLLPKFPGGMDLDVHRAVLEAGEKETGCTVHWVDEGVDTGDIIVQKKCSVEPTDTPETLKAKVQALEGAALIEAIERISNSG